MRMKTWISQMKEKKTKNLLPDTISLRKENTTEASLKSAKNITEMEKNLKIHNSDYSKSDDIK